MSATIDYGKAQVSFYRTYASPLRGITRIPESDFAGRENVLFAAEVDVDVYGDNFLPAYTDGDNSNVVATDTMKNFVFAMALEYEGPTLEGFLAFLGEAFLQTYPQMTSLRLRGRERPFAAAAALDGDRVVRSNVLFERARGDAAFAEVRLGRAEGRTPSSSPTEDQRFVISDSRSGREGLRLIKVTGSSFTRFVRDEYTTLPETVDRPLYLHLDVGWRYADPADATGSALSRYVASEQVRDHVECTFHDFNSRSIQQLVHEMGTRLLARFPQLAEVGFEAENRLWETARRSETDTRRVVYTDPHPTYGRIGLVLRRDPDQRG
ncbi:MAG: urate oxidase [Chloroflexota bacterium]|nr:urate oxidase [Chloroflexota bacterium]